MTKVDMSRRGNGEFAGELCQFKRKDFQCSHYARFEVIVPDTQECFLGCAQHLSTAVTAVWEKGTAAIVKQVPGAWRDTVSASGNRLAGEPLRGGH